jgi:hypothetical protein
MTIGQPYYEPTSSDEEEDEELPDIDLDTDTGEAEDSGEELNDSGLDDVEVEDDGGKVSGCSTVPHPASRVSFIAALVVGFCRRKKT